MRSGSCCYEVVAGRGGMKCWGVKLHSFVRCGIIVLLLVVCATLPALFANGRVKKNMSIGLSSSSNTGSEGRNAPASDACGRKSVCTAADWQNIQLCDLSESNKEDQRSQLVQLQRRWEECTNKENLCDECVELGIREELNLTWIRFSEYVTNPPDENITQRNETIATYRPVIVLCDPGTTGLSICNGESVNVSYLLQGGYKGQDCTSTEYLVGLPYAPYMIDEVIELCSEERDGSHRRESERIQNTDAQLRDYFPVSDHVDTSIKEQGGLRDGDVVTLATAYSNRDPKYEKYITGYDNVVVSVCLTPENYTIEVEGSRDLTERTPFAIHGCKVAGTITKPVYSLCDPESQKLSMCDGQDVHTLFFEELGFVGQDCISASYLIESQYDTSVMYEVAEICKAQGVRYLATSSVCKNCSYNKCCNSRKRRDWETYIDNIDTSSMHTHVHTVQDVRWSSGSIKPFTTGANSHWARRFWTSGSKVGDFKFFTHECGSVNPQNVYTRFNGGSGGHLWIKTGSGLYMDSSSGMLTSGGPDWSRYTFSSAVFADVKHSQTAATYAGTSCYTNREWFDCGVNTDNWCANGECAVGSAACTA